MKICNFRLYSESEANRILWGIRSDLFSVKNVVGFGWYRVTRGSPKLVLAVITRSNFRPKKPCNFKLALILELVSVLKASRSSTLHSCASRSGRYLWGPGFFPVFLGKFLSEAIKISDQYQYLGNCPPTPPLIQH